MTIRKADKSKLAATSGSMNAVTVVSNGYAALQRVAIPKLRDEYVLVRVKAVAVNPYDWKKLYWAGADPGSRCGCDYSGTVEAIGSRVTRFKQGDRIAGFIGGGDRLDHEMGAFAEMAIAKEGLQWKIPDTMSFEEGSTTGAACLTSVSLDIGLEKIHYEPKTIRHPLINLSKPVKPTGISILIHGGSTATGIIGIQFAKAAGLHVIATASAHNHSYLRSLGADAVLDYRSPNCAAEIKKIAKDRLYYAWDCVASGAELCANALNKKRKTIYGTIEEVPAASWTKAKEANPRMNGPNLTFVNTLLNEPFWYDRLIEADSAQYEWVKEFAQLTEALLGAGKIRPVRIILNEGGSGVTSIIHGMDLLKEGKISAGKYVYTL